MGAIATISKSSLGFSTPQTWLPDSPGKGNTLLISCFSFAWDKRQQMSTSVNHHSKTLVGLVRVKHPKGHLMETELNA